MKLGYTGHHVFRNGYHLIFDALPAYLCSQCSESLLDGKTVDVVQASIKAVDAEVKKLPGRQPSSQGFVAESIS